jgi:hypothetical protein
MIRHTVTFKLKHENGSIEETSFLEAARKLSTLPTVQKFECLKEIGKKNNFDFGLSMEFENKKDYEAYNDHPTHVDFVQNKWIPEVIDFIEIDYEL